MPQLQQATVRAPDQFQRPVGDILVGSARENAGQCLMTKVQNRYEMLAAADAALVDGFV